MTPTHRQPAPRRTRFPGAPRALGLALGLAALVGEPPPVAAQEPDRTVAVARRQANPSQRVPVLVSLDNAVGTAGIQVQLNFDPALLEIRNIRLEPLGSNYTLNVDNDNDGIVVLTFTRSTNLPPQAPAPPPGGGAASPPLEANGGFGFDRLASIDFGVNEGALEDLFSSLAVAEVEVADENGVDLSETETIASADGEVAVTLSAFIDDDSDAIPDPWEQSFNLSEFDDSSGGDEDGDGVNNLLEYALNTNPTGRSRQDLPRSGIAFFDLGGGVSGDFLTVDFRRRRSFETVAYIVEGSPDLENWSPLVAEVAVNPIDDDTEMVTVRDDQPLAGTRYVRVRVVPAPPGP